MYFEAESNGIKYEVTVTESRHSWQVSIREGTSHWINHKIPKVDYQFAEDTISLLFNNSSYLVDCIGKDTDYTVFTRGTFRIVKKVVE
jgi:hypothetical protein